MGPEWNAVAVTVLAAVTSGFGLEEVVEAILGGCIEVVIGGPADPMGAVIEGIF